MSLRHWLTDRDIAYNKVVCVHPATDGFSKSKHNLMAVSMTGSWPGADLGTAFVAGADAGKVQDYTGVDPADYNKFALPKKEVEGKLEIVLDEADFIVCWYANYSRSWLEYMFPDQFIGREILDIVPLVKASDQNMLLPTDLTTVSELGARMQKASFHVKGGYKFEEVCARIIPGIDGDTPDAYLQEEATPKLERYVYMLYALWTTLLDR